MAKILTLKGQGAFPWSGELGICVEERSLSDTTASSPIRKDTPKSFIMRASFGESTSAPIELTVNPAKGDGYPPTLLCHNQGVTVLLLCPHCGGTLSESKSEISQSHAIPPEEPSIYCVSCGVEKGIYVEKNRLDLSAPVFDLATLVKSWGQWADSERTAPLNWSCGACRDRKSCYDAGSSLARQRLSVFSFLPYDIKANRHYAWTLRELSSFIAGRNSSPANCGALTGRNVPWTVENFSIQDVFTLKLKLFDAVVGSLQDHYDVHNSIPSVDWDSIFVSVSGSPHGPQFRVVLQDKIINESAHNFPQVEKFRQVRAKFQVTNVGSLEDPHVGASLYLSELEGGLRVGSVVQIAIRKDDGLPVDCALKFKCVGAQSPGIWRLISAEPVATALLQYFRILRVVPAFDVNADIPDLSKTDSAQNSWTRQLGSLLINILFNNGRLGQDLIFNEIDRLAKSIGPDDDPVVAQKIVSGFEHFQPLNLRHDVRINEEMDSWVVSQPVICAARWMYGDTNIEVTGQSLDSIRREIYVWLSMKPFSASNDTVLNESDDELVAILKELAIDLSSLSGEQPKKPELRINTMENRTSEPVVNTSKPPQKQSLDGASLDATMVLTRDDISRLTNSQNMVKPTAKIQTDLESTIVISGHNAAPSFREEKRKPAPVDTQVALDETVVISRTPKPR